MASSLTQTSSADSHYPAARPTRSRGHRRAHRAGRVPACCRRPLRTPRPRCATPSGRAHRRRRRGRGPARRRVDLAGRRERLAAVLRRRRSRPGVEPRDDHAGRRSTLRLDEHSTLTLREPQSGIGSLIELLRGVIHVISRDPRSLRFTTPYANAGLEGTEFDIRVDDDEQQTEVAVLEGQVAVSTPAGAARRAERPRRRGTRRPSADRRAALASRST